MPHILQEMPAYPRSQGDSRDEASVVQAHREEETTTILDGRKRLHLGCIGSNSKLSTIIVYNKDERGNCGPLEHLKGEGLLCGEV